MFVNSYGLQKNVEVALTILRTAFIPPCNDFFLAKHRKPICLICLTNEKLLHIFNICRQIMKEFVSSANFFTLIPQIVTFWWQFHNWNVDFKSFEKSTLCSKFPLYSLIRLSKQLMWSKISSSDSSGFLWSTQTYLLNTFLWTYKLVFNQSN